MKRKNMKAIILAAGYGTRLQTVIGGETPKGLLEKEGVVLIDQMIDELMGLKDRVNEIVLVTNDRFVQAYNKYISENELPIEVISDGSSEPENRLGAIRDLWLAIESRGWQNEEILVLPSDTHYGFSLKDLVDFYDRVPKFTTVFRKLEKSEIANRFGCGVIEGEKLFEFVEKPKEPLSDNAATPFYVYTPEVVRMISEYINSGGNVDSPGSILTWLLANGVEIRAMISNGETIDVGVPQDLDRWVRLKD